MEKELIKNMVSLIVGEALLEFIENPTSPNIVNDLREKYSEKILSAIDSMQEEPTSSVWHDASEKPKEGSWICVSFDSRNLSSFLYEDGKIHNNYVDIEMISCKWAYPEDLLKL